MNNWEILGIEPTRDKDKIKEAYMDKLMVIHPEENPEGFKELRNAYEVLMNEADKEVEEAAEDKSPIGLWIKKIKDVYSRFSERISEDVWREILDDDVCFSLDNMEEAGERLLVFLMDNYYMPQKIWIMLNERFEWTSIKEELYEKFDQGFIDYVESRVMYKDLLNYQYFENIDDSRNYDEWISTFFNINAMLNKREFKDIEKSFDYIVSLGISHPYLDVLFIRYHLMNDCSEKAREIGERIIEKYPEDAKIIYCMAEIEWIEKHIEEAKVLYERVLAIEPQNFDALCGTADCYFELDELEKARDSYRELASRNYYNNYIREQMFKVNEKFIERYKSENSDELEDKFKLSWCLYENQRYDELLELMSDVQIPEDFENQYCDLMGRTYSEINDNEKALCYFTKWRDKILKNLSENKYKNEADMDEDDCGISKERALNHMEYLYTEIGSQLYELKKYDEAVIEYDKGLKQNENNASLLNLKGFTLNKLKRYEESIELFEKASAVDENFAAPYINKAEALHELGYDRDALDSLAQAKNIYPYFSNVYAFEMKIYCNHREYDTALEIYQEAENSNCVSDSILFQKGRALSGKGNLDEALEIILSVIKNAEENENTREFLDELYYETSLIYSDQEEYEKALNLINAAIDVNKDKIKFYYTRAYVYRMLKQFDMSLKDYDHTIEHSPEDEFAYLKEGEIYRIKGDFDKSIEYFKKAIEINSEDTYAYNELGEMYDEKNEYEKALFYYGKQIEIREDSYYLVNRGLLYKRLNRYEEALRDYQRASEIDPENPYPYNNMGVIYENWEEFDKAYSYYKKAIEYMADSKNTIFYNNTIIILKKMRKFEEALRYCDEAIEKLPLEHIFHYRKAELLKVMRRYDEAINEYNIGLEFENADKADYYDEIGDCYKSLEKYDEALKYYEKVLEIKPNHSFEYRQIGNVYRFKEEYHKAIEYFLKQLTINDSNPYTYTCLVMAYKNLDDKENAEKYNKIALEKYIERNNGTIFDASEIGRCYKEMNKYDEAVIYLNKCLNMRACASCEVDECYEAYHLLGEVYEEQGKDEEAYEYFKKAYELAADFDKDCRESFEKISEKLSRK